MLTPTLRFAITVTCLAFVLMTHGTEHVSRGNMDDDYDNDPKWVRLCTLTSNGSSKLNFTMPCGVRIEDEPETVEVIKRRRENTTADSQEDDQYVDSTGDRLETHHEVRNTTADFNETNMANSNHSEVTGGDRDDGDDEVTVEEEDYVDDNDRDEQEEIIVDNDERKEGDDDQLEGGEGDTQDLVTVQAEYEADGKQDERERQRRAKMKKVMFTYLMSAKNQLYDKIRYLLDLLQRAFYKAQLKRRNGRDSADQQMKYTSKRRTRLSKKKQSNVMSVISEPSFERSLMTMSFLMFGVFIIQVIQRLMLTLQKSNDIGSLGNSLTSSLPTAPSSIFNT